MIVYVRLKAIIFRGTFLCQAGATGYFGYLVKVAQICNMLDSN